MGALLFLVPHASGGGAEKRIAALASRMAEERTVYLVTTLPEDGAQPYAFSEAVHYINLPEWAKARRPQGPSAALRERAARLAERVRRGLGGSLLDEFQFLTGHLLRVQSVIGPCGSLLQYSKGIDDLPRHGLLSHAEPELHAAALGLGAPVPVGRHPDLAHGIVFNAIIH